MNYLAHLALSNYNDEHLIGNFLTDLMHRSEFTNFSDAVYHGHILHQKIDSFTDRHGLVLEAKALMGRKSRRYAGILLDMYFDHLLVQHWSTFYDDDLDDFITYTYELLSSYEDNFPHRAKHFSQRLRSYDLFRSYAKVEGIKQALKGVDKRLKKPVGLDNLLEDVLEHKARVEELFLLFYKDLQKHIK